VHLTLIPYLSAAKELKTKPTQHSVRLLSQEGVHPNVIVCRTEHPLNEDIKRKIALFCNVKPEAVIEAIDAGTIYQVPLKMLEEGLDVIVLKKLQINGYSAPDLFKWNSFLDKLTHSVKTVNIGLIGKYVELQDAYKSILEAFVHAGAINLCIVNVVNVHSEFITEDNVAELLYGLDALLVAPGFGIRGVEGKIEAVKYARENNLPFFGICLGMQMSVIEFGRNVLHLEGAHSTEMEPHTPHPVIDLMEVQKQITVKGGTMRLGSYPCALVPGSLAERIYGKSEITERHRHRWEFNNEYIPQYEAAGFIFSGKNIDSELVEIVELKNHPFFIGVQFHPELKSTVENPHPLFVHFINAAKNYAEQKNIAKNIAPSMED
jgi:CTP synthase